MSYAYLTVFLEVSSYRRTLLYEKNRKYYFQIIILKKIINEILDPRKMTELEDEAILDMVTKYRWFISLVMGPLWGLLGLKGILGIALYGVIITALSVLLVKNHRWVKTFWTEKYRRYSF